MTRLPRLPGLARSVAGGQDGHRLAAEEAPAPAILSGPIDAEAYIRACPARATTLGTFFHHVREAVVERTGGTQDRLFAGVSRDRWISFRKYELREFMRLLVNAAGILHADQPLGEGLRRLGWLAYPSFASTMAGRVVLFALGEGLEEMAEALPKAYALGVPEAHVESKKLGPRHYLIRLSDVHCFVDTYHLGVIEGAFTARHVVPRIVVRLGKRSCDAEFEGTW